MDPTFTRQQHSIDFVVVKIKTDLEELQGRIERTAGKTQKVDVSELAVIVPKESWHDFWKYGQSILSKSC